MWECANCREQLDDEFQACWSCGTSREGEPDPAFSKSDAAPPDEQLDPMEEWEELRDFPLTTTPSMETHRITGYLGVVCGEAIIGTDLFSDLFAGVADILGGRSPHYEMHLKTARSLGTLEMIREAVDKGANAVVGVRVDYEVVRGSMMLVSCTGTAVTADPIP